MRTHRTLFLIFLFLLSRIRPSGADLAAPIPTFDSLTAPPSWHIVAFPFQKIRSLQTEGMLIYALQQGAYIKKEDIIGSPSISTSVWPGLNYWRNSSVKTSRGYYSTEVPESETPFLPPLLQ